MTHNDLTSRKGLTSTSEAGWVSPGLRRYISLPALPDDSLEFSQVVRFLLLHVPLMLVFRSLPMIGTAHSLVVVLLGLHFLIKDDRPVRVAAVLAYLAGAEILWRGTGALLIWEYSKYATIFLGILLILKYRAFGRNAVLPVLFMLLLVPGIFVAPGFDREAVSFQLAGPMALGIVSIAFGAFEFKRSELQQIFLGMIAPTISMGFLMVLIVLRGGVADFSFGENEIITGGIGANQVSSALSLGAMAAFFYIFLSRKDLRARNLMIWISLLLLGLSALTFSRAGLWNMVIAIAIGGLFLMRSRRGMLNLLAIGIVAGSFIYFIAYPLLNDVTSGALTARYRDFDSTGRDVLVEIDYNLFKDHTIWGVGVGESPKFHAFAFGYPKPTHTEYSRLLAEHGSLGLAAMAVLAIMTLGRLFSRRSAFSKGISMGFTVWSLLYMVHSATRMVAPSFAFGFAAARFLFEDETNTG